MHRIIRLLPVAIVSTALAGSIAFAQAPPQPNTAPGAATTDNQRLDRQLNSGAAAARRQKRAQCDAQAKQQKIRLFARMKFMRQCLKG